MLIMRIRFVNSMSVVAARCCRVVALASLAGFFAGCGSLPQITPYQIEIQQGNFLSQELVAQLKPGLTKDQVRFLLGTPLIVDPFHTDRWDYVFLRRMENRSEVERRHMSVHFEEGRLKRIEGDVVTGGSTSSPSSGVITPAESPGK